MKTSLDPLSSDMNLSVKGDGIVGMLKSRVQKLVTCLRENEKVWYSKNVRELDCM